MTNPAPPSWKPNAIATPIGWADPVTGEEIEPYKGLTPAAGTTGATAYHPNSLTWAKARKSTAVTLAVTSTGQPVHGTPYTITVTAKNVDGNLAAGYNGTIHITSSDGGATLPANAAAVNGVKTFLVTISTTGTFTITATDTVTSTITGNKSVTAT